MNNSRQIHPYFWWWIVCVHKSVKHFINDFIGAALTRCCRWSGGASWCCLLNFKVKVKQKSVYLFIRQSIFITFMHGVSTTITMRIRYDVKTHRLLNRARRLIGRLFAFLGVWLRQFKMKGPLQESRWIVCWADMARTIEFISHFVSCDTVTVSPNWIITNSKKVLLITGWERLTHLQSHI